MADIAELEAELSKRGALPDASAAPSADQSGEALKTVSSINTIIADTLGKPVDLMNSAIGTLQPELQSKEPFLGSQSIKRAMKALNISEGEVPESWAGQLTADTVGGAVEAGLTGFGAGKVVSGAGEFLASPTLKGAGAVIGDTGANITAGAGGAVGGDVAKEAFKGTDFEGPAEIGGTLLGGGVAGLAKGGQKIAQQVTDPVIHAYESLGLVPSVGEAASKEGFGGRTAQWLQGNMLPQSLGGSNVMERFKVKRMKELNDIRLKIADSYGRAETREGAGQSIQEQVMDTWSKRKAADGQLIGDLTKKYANDPIYPSELIDALTDPIGAATTRGVREKTVDPLVGELSEMLRSTKSGGQLTFKDLAALKQYVGDKLEPGVVKNVSDAQVGQIFKAIRDDMENYVKSQSPEDFTKLQESRARYAKAMEDFGQHFKKLIGSEQVKINSERAYDILTSAAGEKGRGNLELFRHVWDALPPSAQGDLASTVLIRMGATDIGNPRNVESWSLTKFITAYNTLAPEAKSMLFDANKPARKDLDNLTVVVKNIEDKINRLMSTSRSGAGAIQYGQMTAGAVGLVSALGGIDLKAIALTLGSFGGPHMAAEMLTNPKAIKFVAGAMSRLDDVIESAARADIALNAVPKMHPQQQKPGPNFGQEQREGDTAQKYGAKDLKTAQDIGKVGEHADWAKFEKEARPSENVEDERTDNEAQQIENRFFPVNAQ